MLQQILTDMYIDPDVLKELSEDQKKILFLKMRQEQVRRWHEREGHAQGEGPGEATPRRKGHSKSVSWLLGRDGDVSVCVIGEQDEFRSSKILFDLRGAKLHNNTSSLAIRTPSEVQTQRKAFQPSSQAGIQLLFQVSQEDPDSGNATDNLKDPDSGNSTDDLVSNYRPHRRSRDTPITSDSLRLHNKSPAEPRLQEQQRVSPDVSSVFGGRVAQLRRTFNSSNGKRVPASSKPPVPTKPPHVQFLAPDTPR